MITKNSNQPIYVQIQHKLLEMIKNNELLPGNSVFSENDLAKQLGVSRLTVRKAYAGMVEKGIFQTVQGKGTFVSPEFEAGSSERTVEKRKSQKITLGVIFPEITVLFPDILKAIEEKATEKNYILNIMINDTVEKEIQAINQMAENGVDGIIITPIRFNGYTSYNNYKALISKKVPFVMIGKPPCNIPCDAVYCDDVHAAYETVEYLINMGHRRILHLTNSDTDMVAYEERKTGYIKAVEDHLSSRDIIILDTKDEEWRRVLKDYLKDKNPVTAVFAFDDLSAADVYSLAVSEGKRVPEDISIIGYNNTEICTRLPVKLSSVAQPRSHMGYLAFDLIEENIENVMEKRVGGYKKYIVLSNNLMIRESSGKLER